MAYTGLFWPNDSSPATRYGTAAILSAVALNFATRVIQPSINYLTVKAAAFLILYINILISIIIVTIVFYLHKRQQMDKADKVLKLGRILMPSLLLISIGTIIMFTVSTKHLYKDIYQTENNTEFICNNKDKYHLSCTRTEK